MELALMRYRIRAVIARARSDGLRKSAAYLRFRAYEEFHEAVLGIRTFEYRPPDALGYRNPDLEGYAPAPYRALYKCLGRVPVRHGTDVFLDYGVGLGRAAIVAARRPFARVIGIDLSAELVQGARRNVDRARPRLRCDVHVEHADARTYRVPADVTVIHLYNPFGGEVLASVVEHIRHSLRENPREITIIYGNPGAFRRLVEGQGWVEELYFGEFYPAIGYGVYRCRHAG